MRYDQLEAYKVPYKLALAVHKVSAGIAKEERYGGFVSQIRRSSTSVCANIAEGLSKYMASEADERRFLAMALGSLEEMRFWLSFGRDVGYLDAEYVENALKDYEYAAKLLFGLMQRRKGKAT